MAGNVRILGIAGSVRKASFNKFALREAQKLVPEGASMEIFDIEGPAQFQSGRGKEFAGQGYAAEGEDSCGGRNLFVTPEYNYSIPGVLKNAIDWAS